MYWLLIVFSFAAAQLYTVIGQLRRAYYGIQRPCAKNFHPPDQDSLLPSERLCLSASPSQMEFSSRNFPSLSVSSSLGIPLSVYPPLGEYFRSLSLNLYPLRPFCPFRLSVSEAGQRFEVIQASFNTVFRRQRVTAHLDKYILYTRGYSLGDDLVEIYQSALGCDTVILQMQ